MVKNKIKIGIVTALIFAISLVSIFTYKTVYSQNKITTKKAIIVKTSDWQIIAEMPREN